MNTVTRLKLDNRVRLLALLGVLVLGNLLAQDAFVRLDLTEDRVYSLSPATKKILDGLERPVEIRAYFTEDLQAPYSQYAAAVRDKLDEYKAYAGGKIHFEFKDPTGDEALEEEARRFGILDVQVDYRDRDQREIRRAYMGVAFVSGSEQTSLPLLRQLGTLEYDITRSILAVTEPTEKKTVAFLTGHDEPDLTRPSPQGGPNALMAALEERYTVTTFNSAEDDQVPDDVDVLLVFAPTKPLGDRDLFVIDQYLMSGRSAGFFPMGHTLDPRQGGFVPIPHNLTGLLDHYGLELRPDLVIDRTQSGRRQFPVRQGRMVLPMVINYPLIPLVTDVSDESIITREVDALPMPFTASIAVKPEAEAREGARITPLLRSSPGSSRLPEGLPPYDPSALKDPAPGEEPGPFTLGVSYQGPLTSYFAESGPPGDPGLEGRDVTREGPVTRLVLIGGAEWIQGNLDMLLNAVDWLAQDERLATIRNRQVSTPPLTKPEPAEQALIKAANLAGLPILLILLGLIRWRVRAGRRA